LNELNSPKGFFECILIFPNFSNNEAKACSLFPQTPHSSNSFLRRSKTRWPLLSSLPSLSAFYSHFSRKIIRIVTAVGKETEIGAIQQHVEEAEQLQSPLQIKLDKFGDIISKHVLFICIITWFANIPNFEEAGQGNWLSGRLSFFKLAVLLAAAAVPERLPAVVTTALSLGVSRMAKENAIITQLTAVETLGCTSVIWSDRTGTIAENKMAA
jgi:P-type E1-E2 ATPase